MTRPPGPAPVRRVGADERRGRLALRHRLHPDTRGREPGLEASPRAGLSRLVPDLADDLVALHSSDPVTVHLSAGLRLPGPAGPGTVPAVERALYDDRSVLRHHSVRRTLWVATPEVTRLLHAAATRKVAATERRRLLRMLALNGAAPDESAAERWVADGEREVLALLHDRGELTAREVGRALPHLRHPLALAPGTSYAGSQGAHTRLLLQLGFEGAVLRARPSSWVDGAYRYAPAETWAGRPLERPAGHPDRWEEEAAATLLADRWLRRFGPATTEDLRWWTGWTLGLTRTALAGCEAVPVALDGAAGWLAAADVDPVPDPGPWVAALPSLDPTTMGWKQREWYLPAACADAFDAHGNAGATLWVDGVVVGAWAQRPDGEIRAHYFLRVPAPRRRELDAELHRVAALVGDTRFTVRFPGRVQSRLLA